MTDQQGNEKKIEDLAILRASINRQLTQTRYFAAAFSVFLGGFIVFGLLGAGYL
ncbi:hypothetical protein [Azonexus hydrophilus]|jgi:hypothetical protein|uniref:hypothetical protein n=1 Tax=Azonexus hydrophilus TaxID=418702 RepID=UPI0017535E5F|nr:hypothetical protein [Azonexus hydrophilus]MDX9737442.1 hypothetical protein [Azonexus sp.]HHV50061.1 hypothetical protein [Rhodocyclaceae bacterium]